MELHNISVHWSGGIYLGEFRRIGPGRGSHSILIFQSISSQRTWLTKQKVCSDLLPRCEEEILRVRVGLTSAWYQDNKIQPELALSLSTLIRKFGLCFPFRVKVNCNNYSWAGADNNELLNWLKIWYLNYYISIQSPILCSGVKPAFIMETRNWLSLSLESDRHQVSSQGHQAGCWYFS